MTYRIRIYCPRCLTSDPHRTGRCFGWVHRDVEHQWVWMREYGQTLEGDDIEAVAGNLDRFHKRPNPLGWTREVIDMSKPLPPLPVPVPSDKELDMDDIPF